MTTLCVVAVIRVRTLRAVVGHVHMVFTMMQKRRARENIEPILRSIGNHRQRNVNRSRTIPPKVNVVGVGNVVNDELPWVRLVTTRRGHGSAGQAETQHESQNPQRKPHVAVVWQCVVHHRRSEFGCEDSHRFPTLWPFSSRRTQKYQMSFVGETSWRIDSATKTAVNAA